MRLSTKVVITVLGMAVCVYRPEVAGEVSVMVLAYNGANVGATFAHKTEKALSRLRPMAGPKKKS